MDGVSGSAPPVAVMRAFGATEPPTPLGRSGDVWRSGSVVLKRTQAAEDALAAEARVLGSVPDAGFRLQRLRRARDGSLAVDGWIARDYLAGRDATGNWRGVIGAADALHAALRAVTRRDAAPMIDGRTDPWATADRMAWGEEPIPAAPPFDVDPIRTLAAAGRPPGAPSQLIHGDLSGNVLLAADALPGIIDFSPYYRPAAYAIGIVVVDAVLWHGANLDLVASLGGRPGMGECLRRAILFRHLTAVIAGGEYPRATAGTPYAALVAAALALR